MFNATTKKWQQTWVDNQAGYLLFTGQFENGEMTLSTHPETGQKGNINISRMVFYNITRNDFDWRWEKTTDGGKSWNLDWKIHYQRK